MLPDAYSLELAQQLPYSYEETHAILGILARAGVAPEWASEILQAQAANGRSAAESRKIAEAISWRTHAL